jgi:hypothetical protein
MPGISPAVEAGNYHNPMFLHLEEYPVGKTPHSRTPPPAVDNRELQGVFRDCFHRCLDRQRETLPKRRAYVVIPGPRILKILFRFW